MRPALKPCSGATPHPPCVPRRPQHEVIRIHSFRSLEKDEVQEGKHKCSLPVSNPAHNHAPAGGMITGHHSHRDRRQGKHFTRRYSLPSAMLPQPTPMLKDGQGGPQRYNLYVDTNPY